MPKVVPDYKEEARQRIVAAGFAVMSRKGYCAMTMDDIAAQIGVSKGALYLYYKTKDELVLEIIKTISDEVEETLKESVSGHTPLDEWTMRLDNHLTKNALNHSLFLEVTAMAARNETIRKDLLQKMTNWIDMATRNLEARKGQGLIRSDADSRTLALSIVSIFMGFLMLSAAGIDRQEIRERWMIMGKLLFATPSQPLNGE